MRGVHLLPRRHGCRLQEYIVLMLLLFHPERLHHSCLSGRPCHYIGHRPLQVDVVPIVAY